MYLSWLEDSADNRAVMSSILIIPTTLYGFVVQLVRTPACHAGGRGFKSHRSRQYADLTQLGECFPYKEEVRGSSPLVSTIYVPIVQRIEQGPSKPYM